MNWRRILGLLALGLLPACGPEATPFPVDVPLAPTATPSPGVSAGIRYALAANTQGYVTDLPVLEAAAQVIFLTEPVEPSDLGTRYDLIAAYGDFPGSERSPVTSHALLAINPLASPLQAEMIARAVKDSINPDALVLALDIPGTLADPGAAPGLAASRSALANAGWPDGFDARLADVFTPGAEILVEQLAAIGVHADAQPMPEPEALAALQAGAIHFVLTTWKTPAERQVWVERVGEQNLLDLYTLPISYRAASPITLDFTPSGWPLPIR